MVPTARVLVVDDEPRILRLVRASLSLAGFEVLTTTSGAEAISLVQSESPDIVLLDVVMHPVDGLTVLKGLRAFSHIPVLLFTARRYTTEEARDLGANGVIAKPFRAETMVRSIETALSNR